METYEFLESKRLCDFKDEHTYTRYQNLIRIADTTYLMRSHLLKMRRILKLYHFKFETETEDAIFKTDNLVWSIIEYLGKKEIPSEDLVFIANVHDQLNFCHPDTVSNINRNEKQLYLSLLREAAVVTIACLFKISKGVNSQKEQFSELGSNDAEQEIVSRSVTLRKEWNKLFNEI